MKISPLRSKLAVYAAIFLTFGVMLCLAAVTFHMHHEQVEDVESDLNREARRIFAMARSNPSTSELPALVETMLSDEADRRVAELRDGTGRVLFRSSQLGGSSLIDEARKITPTRGTFRYLRLGGDRARVGIYEKDGRTLAIGASLATIDEGATEVLPVLLLVSPVFVLLIALGASAIASHALRPIEDLAAAAEHVTARELSQRLPEVQADEEIKRLTRVLNRMMERLETSFRQVERFTSDASHELKTPLTIIHGQLETALRTLHFSEEQEELLLSTLQEVRRLSRIVDNLLLLSRSDAGRLELTAEILDLSAMVEELREDADVLGADSDLRVEAEVEADVRVKADPAYLRQLLLNLLDNACKYNKRGGVVRFHLGVENRQAVFRIGNTGNDIPSEQQTRLFERFFRGDPARQRTTEGSGLGLSISREIARAHGGEVVLARSDWEWTEFVLTLPIASGTIALPRIETPSERAAETHSATAVESVTARSC